MTIAIFSHLAALGILLILVPRWPDAAHTWVASAVWATVFYAAMMIPTCLTDAKSPGFLDDEQWKQAALLYARATIAMLALSLVCVRGEFTSLWWTPVLFPAAAMTAVVCRSWTRLQSS